MDTRVELNDFSVVGGSIKLRVETAAAEAQPHAKKMIQEEWHKNEKKEKMSNFINFIAYSERTE